jgi:hypothetical protein
LSGIAIAWLVDLLSMIVTLTSLVGLGWKKKILFRLFWQVFFFFSLVWNLSNAYFTYDGTFTVVVIAVYLPSLLGTYLYAFRSSDIWRSAPPGSI